MFNALRVRWRDFRAWRRGERLVAPREQRGRIFEKKPASGGIWRRALRRGDERLIKHETSFKVSARVIRVDGRPDEFHDLSGGN